MSVYAIGEALIDFVPNRAGSLLSGDIAFIPAVGGAPLNVAAAIAKLGGKSAILSQVGLDDFGEMIIQTVKNCGVDCNYLLQTKEAKTALAFVSLREDGERSFSFYRNPSADMLYSAKNLESINPSSNDILHFCSVSLSAPIMKEAHEKAIEKFRANGGGISFDINIRLPLWNSVEECVKAVQDFIPKADLIKISDDELPLVSGKKDIEEGVKTLFVGNVKQVIYTKGAKGAMIFNKSGLLCDVNSYKVVAVDATGAGDAFTGATLYQLQKQNIALNSDWSAELSQNILAFSTAVGALTTLKRGAINALPSLEEVNTLIANETCNC